MMKKIVLLLLTVALFSCKSEPKKAEISVQAPNLEFAKVKYPIDDIPLWENLTDTIYRNENDVFVFEKEVSKPMSTTLEIGDQSLQIIITPESKIEVKKIDSSYHFLGENGKVMELLNTFKRPYVSDYETDRFVKDTTAAQIKNKIQLLKDKELSQIQKQLDTTKIDPVLLHAIHLEIDYYYAFYVTRIVLSKDFINGSISKELLDLLNETVKEYPLEVAYKSSMWLYYAKTVLWDLPFVLYLKENNIGRAEVYELFLKDELHPLEYDLIMAYNNAEVKEKVAAYFIFYTAKNRHFEKSLIGLFDRFKTTYPNSAYTQYIAPEITMIKEYHEKIAQELPKDVEIIDGEDIHTMEQLAEKLKGQKYYIDVWASWCGPCKGEFKYNAQLDSLLKIKGYKKLYISLDREETKDKWLEGIKYYNLHGVHLRASQKYFEHFEKRFSTVYGRVQIPQYLIIDDDGTILTNNAPRPSDLKNLTNMLDTLQTRERRLNISKNNDYLK